MSLSVIIPAFDEEVVLPTTLNAVSAEAASFDDGQVETLVVDNGSTDRTAAVARKHLATVVHEPVRNVARARNRGAAESSGELLVFLDADVALPAGLLQEISRVMEDPSCVGGGCEVRYQPKKRSVRVYLWAWRVLGRWVGAVQGATQFVRRDAFESLNGYDETLWMGEDVDFHWRLRALARKAGKRVVTLKEPVVHASARRYDQWPLHRTLLYTNPLFILVSRRRPGVWSGWYHDPPR